MKTMLNDVRRRKLSYLFSILDINKDHHLQPDDFVEVANKISDVLGLDEHSKKRIRIQMKSMRLYVQVLTDLEKEDGSISLDEWFSLFDPTTPVTPRISKKYVVKFATYIFMLFDQDENNYISKEEYLDMFSIYNIDLSFSAKSFELLDENSDGKISVDEMIRGFKDFLTSSKPDQPGNWIFGDWQSHNILIADEKS